METVVMLSGDGPSTHDMRSPDNVIGGLERHLHGGVVGMHDIPCPAVGCGKTFDGYDELHEHWTLSHAPEVEL